MPEYKSRFPKKRRLAWQERQLAADNIAREAEADFPLEAMLPVASEDVRGVRVKQPKPEFPEPETDAAAKLVARADAAEVRAREQEATTSRLYDPNDRTSTARTEEGYPPIDSDYIDGAQRLRAPKPFVPKPVTGKTRIRGESEGDTQGTFETVPALPAEPGQLALGGIEGSIARHPTSPRVE